MNQQEISNQSGEEKVTTCRVLTEKEGPFNKLFSELEVPFGGHLANVDWQPKAYATLKNNLSAG